MRAISVYQLPIFILFIVLSSNSFAATIDWQLENPFRFFLDKKLYEMHATQYQQLSPNEKENNPVSSIEANLNHLSTSNQLGWAASYVDDLMSGQDLSSQHCWDYKNRTISAACPDFIIPKNHTIVASLSSQLKGQHCNWIVDSKTIHKDVSCSQTVSLSLPYGKISDVQVMNSTTNKLFAKQEIKVKDLLIVGLGDSFASGEGNPDHPTEFSDDTASDKGLPLPDKFGEDDRMDAYWLDRRCHRSFYSHQMRAALQLAVEFPQQAITFIPLSCSGAKITKGLLEPYDGVEGIKKNKWPHDEVQRRNINNPTLDGFSGSITQISAVVNLLCPADKINIDNWGRSQCSDTFLRNIDRVMLSIGGNDVKFGGMVANLIIDNWIMKRLTSLLGVRVKSKTALKKIFENLPELYDELELDIRNRLNVRNPHKIFLTAYPIPLYDKSSNVCGDNDFGMDWNSSLDFDIAEAKKVSNIVLPALNAVMKKSAQKFEWRFVNSFQKEFIPHGWCSDPDLNIMTKKTGEWQPAPPSTYRPYAKTNRWFRSPVDVYLTIHRRIDALKTKLNRWMLVHTSGAFHPTAYGHAVVADHLVKALKTKEASDY